MTLEMALEITGIREDDLIRIDVDTLDCVIEDVKREVARFSYDKKLKVKLDAYETIRREVQ